ncbi:MAG: YDG domain-containing protein, partial [Clostridia bacterium]|nr:YDG domain-containing protein [Clostridia bacterium]
MNKFFKALMLSLVLIPCTFLFIGCGEVMNLTSSQLQSQYLITDYDGTEKKPNVQVYIGQKLIPATNYTTTYANNINAGVATITVTGKNGYIGKKTRNFEIKQLNLSTAGPTITLAGSSFVYTNNPIEPAVTSVVVKDAIIPTTEYDIAYSDNTNPGTATVTISGKGSNVTGLATKTFSITGGEITMTSENTVINLVQEEFEYTGSAIINVIDSIKVNGTTLVAGDYTAIYSNNIELGTATITITGKGGYKGTIIKTFEIVKNLSTAVIALESDSMEYSKSAINMPITSVVLGTQTLTEQDYTVTYSNNINAGEATVTITGAGNYRGTATKTFEITKKAITVATISEAEVTKTYDGMLTADITGQYEFSGVITGDIVELDYTSAFDNANVGTNKTVTVSDLNINNTNYKLTTTSFTLVGT